LLVVFVLVVVVCRNCSKQSPEEHAVGKIQFGTKSGQSQPKAPKSSFQYNSVPNPARSSQTLQKSIFVTQFGTKSRQIQPGAPKVLFLIQFGTKSGQIQPEAPKEHF
jgi:hypothetical protein